MFSPWLDIAGTRAKLDRWSEGAGLDLIQLGTVADAETIQDTAVAQPLIVALSLLAYEEMTDLPPRAPVAGHSVGEIAAAAIAGVLSARDAVAFAAVRGAEMAKACAIEPSGMAAVMMGDPEQVVSWLAEHGLSPPTATGRPDRGLGRQGRHRPHRRRAVGRQQGRELKVRAPSTPAI